MSDEKPSDTKPAKEDNTASTRASSLQVDERALEKLIDSVPPAKREEFQHTFQQILMAFVERSSGPNINPETAKILAASADKESDHRFEFLVQKQKDEADESKRGYEFEVMRHKDRVKIFWPILITVLVVTVGCLAVGIYLAATGHNQLGTGIITGTSFAVAGYLAGVGTSGFFREE